LSVVLSNRKAQRGWIAQPEKLGFCFCTQVSRANGMPSNQYLPTKLNGE
jgi:hypothetical protein